MAKILIVGLVAVAALVSGLVVFGPRLQRAFFYPTPAHQATVNAATTTQLIQELQAVLETKAPTVVAHLQAGLSDSEIDQLERLGEFTLSTEIRVLYKWRNGTGIDQEHEFIPGHRFISLQEIVRERKLLRDSLVHQDWFNRAATNVFIAHRQNWIPIFVDGAGDGYFYDPGRPAFFYNMAEVRYYLWFPSLRNFLAGTIECYASGAFTLSSDGIGLEEDYDRSFGVWNRVAVSN